MNVRLLLILTLAAGAACSEAPRADLLLTGGVVYTMNPAQPRAEAVAVRDGAVVWCGTAEEARRWTGSGTEVMDLGGRTLVPGFIEGHAHLMGVGEFKQRLDLSRVRSYGELLDSVAAAARRLPPGAWILGRGWHQSKWSPAPPMVTGYQTNERLDSVSPAHPVLLEHASGHAVFVNSRALELAGVGPDTRWGGDGEIIRHPDGRPTGILTEAAARLVERQVPPPDAAALRATLDAALAECLRNGITAFHDAGAGQATLDLYAQYAAENRLPIRLYAMLDGSDSLLLERWYQRGPLTGPYLTVRAIKLYSDGALGSRGAWLLTDYHDRPGHQGNPILSPARILRTAREGLQHGFQVCTHAIGDRANREVLDQYEAAFAEFPDRARHARFRIEHAQHIDPQDIPRFAALGVIPAMQAIHLSSDRPWAIDRLGQTRIDSGAYRWQTLLRSGARIVNGTDAPVEPLSPIACFYASVTRKTLAGEPPAGYEPAECMTREQALRSYTADAAYGAFQEQAQGQIAPGFRADFTLLSQDLMTVPEDQILRTRIVATIVGGVIRYRAE
ncbi:MAG: amidohydrolase [Bacteroidia bacterium]|nr:amidohydrolase [Bacteroidia bacterium]